MRPLIMVQWAVVLAGRPASRLPSLWYGLAQVGPSLLWQGLQARPQYGCTAGLGNDPGLECYPNRIVDRSPSWLLMMTPAVLGLCTGGSMMAPRVRPIIAPASLRPVRHRVFTGGHAFRHPPGAQGGLRRGSSRRRFLSPACCHPRARWLTALQPLLAVASPACALLVVPHSVARQASPRLAQTKSRPSQDQVKTRSRPCPPCLAWVVQGPPSFWHPSHATPVHCCPSLDIQAWGAGTTLSRPPWRGGRGLAGLLAAIVRVAAAS